LTPLFKEHKMKILWINNDLAGFADYLEVAPGTTIEKFLAEKLGGRDPADYLIRVNRQPVAKDHVRQEGDRILGCLVFAVCLFVCCLLRVPCSESRIWLTREHINSMIHCTGGLHSTSSAGTLSSLCDLQSFPV